MQELLELQETEPVEALLTVQDRTGRELIRAAVNRAKVVGDLAQELADLSDLPPGQYALLTADGTERMDPTRTLGDNLAGQTEAEVRLVSELTGN